MGKTTVTVSDENADRLHDRKRRGESYDDVVERLLNNTEPTATAQN